MDASAGNQRLDGQISGVSIQRYSNQISQPFPKLELRWQEIAAPSMPPPIYSIGYPSCSTQDQIQQSEMNICRAPPEDPDSSMPARCTSPVCRLGMYITFSFHLFILTPSRFSELECSLIGHGCLSVSKYVIYVLTSGNQAQTDSKCVPAISKTAPLNPRAGLSTSLRLLMRFVF